MNSTAVLLHLDDLADGMPGITPKYGAFLVEAAVVCLEGEAHVCGVAMMVDGDYERRFLLQWAPLADGIQLLGPGLIPTKPPNMEPTA